MKTSYFGTDGIRGRVGEHPIHPEFMLKLGWALGKALWSTYHRVGKVLIGKDTRISGYMLESALEAGLSAAGMDVLLLGPMPTPGVAYLTKTLRAIAGVVISASHNPYYDNGIKFFSEQGFKFGDDLQEKVEAYLEESIDLVNPSKLGKASRLNDAPGRYIEYCKNTLPLGFSLSGMKIVLDCAYGATYLVAPCVLRELGAEVVELGVEPDGVNINENAGSTHPEILQKVVLGQQADVGVALDGDGDRLIMVDHEGEIVDGDELIYIMVEHAKSLGRFKGGVVGTLMSNLGLEKALKSLGVPFERTKVGDRYVMEKLKERGWELGGENSGHIVNLGVTTTGDGVVSALQILYAMQDRAKNLKELRQNIQKMPQVLKNVPIRKQNLSDKKEDLAKIAENAEKAFAGDGRVLLRPSGTEPFIRVMVEGEDIQKVEATASQLVEQVKEAIG